jgi:hypothetical protein
MAPWWSGKLQFLELGSCAEFAVFCDLAHGEPYDDPKEQRRWVSTTDEMKQSIRDVPDQHRLIQDCAVAEDDSIPAVWQTRNDNELLVLEWLRVFLVL